MNGTQQASCPGCGVLLSAGPSFPPHIPGCRWFNEYANGTQNCAHHFKGMENVAHFTGMASIYQEDGAPLMKLGTEDDGSEIEGARK